MFKFRKNKKTFAGDQLTPAEQSVQDVLDARAAARKAKGIPVGYRLRYTGKSFQAGPGMVNIHLVPLLDKPLYPFAPPTVGKDECPTCRVIHPVKTIHLWLDSSQSVLVSKGVLDLLKKAGLEVHELELVGSAAPPALTLNGKASRREVDQANERITRWS